MRNGSRREGCDLTYEHIQNCSAGQGPIIDSYSTLFLIPVHIHDITLNFYMALLFWDRSLSCDFVLVQPFASLPFVFLSSRPSNLLLLRASV